MKIIFKTKVTEKQSKDIFTSMDPSQDGKVSFEELHQDYDFVISNEVESPDQHDLRMRQQMILALKKQVYEDITRVLNKKGNRMGIE